jgi:hypothetical protein
MGAGCVVALIGVVFGSIFRGYALSVLWRWFVVSAFHLPEIGIAAAIGLSLLIGAFANTNSKVESKYDSVLQAGVAALILSFLLPAMLLGMGWIVKAFL